MTKKFEIKTRLDFAKVICFVKDDLLNYVNGSQFEPFDVTIEKHKEDKTPKQLKGFWRLCEHIALHLRELEGTIWDKKRVAQYLCIEAGFACYYKEIPTAKSVAHATKEEMSLILSNLIVFGAEMDIPDCTLTSKEEEAFNNYYGVEK